MTERININGSDVWIKIESHVVTETEYFTATGKSTIPHSPFHTAYKKFANSENSHLLCISKHFL